MKSIDPIAEINLTNFKNNMNLIKDRLNENVKIMLIVKSNAYGHGAVRVAKCANDINIRNFGVATLSEAIELRENNIKGEILIFGYVSPVDLNKIFDYDLTLSISDLTILEKINANKKIKIHLNIDTGLSRSGFYMQHSKHINIVYRQILQIIKNENISITGIFTHFASSEKNKKFTFKQLKIFNELLTILKINKINYGIVHASNSAATLKYDQSHFNMVRIGILGYGINITKIPLNVKPVMRLIGTLVHTKKLKPGDKVGYGMTFKAKRETTLGLVNIGYADGIRRNLSNNCFFTLNNVHVKCIGRISMDILAIDITNCSYNLYDKVIVFGNKDFQENTLTDIAKRTKSIEYEFLCTIGNRIKRIYIE